MGLPFQACIMWNVLPQKHGKQNDTQLYWHTHTHIRLLRLSPTQFPGKITRKLFQPGLSFAMKFSCLHRAILLSHAPVFVHVYLLNSNPIKLDTDKYTTHTVTHIKPPAPPTPCGREGKIYLVSFPNADATQCCQIVKYSVGRNSLSSSLLTHSHCHHLRISYAGRSCRYLFSMHIHSRQFRNSINFVLARWKALFFDEFS